ncbi:Zinc finger Y-chromosomal protein [Armadillidium vulgare]|nr:Zinc finger Y-chromosomal protein [Armadillidium vulgare]
MILLVLKLTDFVFLLQVYQNSSSREGLWSHSSVSNVPVGGEFSNLSKRKRCAYCIYETASTECLRRHIRFKHTKERPFQCSICNKSFATKYDLRSHVRIHTGEKPYKCFYCSQTFAQSSNRSTHMKSKHM